MPHGFNGKIYQPSYLLNSPQSISRPRVPIMIGGGGEQKTLRLVAQYADASNVFGGPVPLPVWSSLDLFALSVAAISFVGLWKFRWKVIPVVLASAAAGLVYKVVL